MSGSNDETITATKCPWLWMMKQDAVRWTSDEGWQATIVDDKRRRTKLQSIQSLIQNNRTVEQNCPINWRQSHSSPHANCLNKLNKLLLLNFQYCKLELINEQTSIVRLTADTTLTQRRPTEDWTSSLADEALYRRPTRGEGGGGSRSFAKSGVKNFRNIFRVQNRDPLIFKCKPLKSWS